MSVFEIDRFSISEISEGAIRATVGWPDDGTQKDYDPKEETQEILWSVQDFQNIDDALTVLETAADLEKFDMDLIRLEPNDLSKIVATKYNWNEDKITEAIDTLLKIKVNMIDNGQATDSFFVHF